MSGQLVRSLLIALATALVGAMLLVGAFYGYKSGHALNNKLARALLAETECWEYASFEDESLPSPTTPAVLLPPVPAR